MSYLNIIQENKLRKGKKKCINARWMHMDKLAEDWKKEFGKAKIK